MSKQYALLFDLKRCIGCRTCTIACKVENDLPVGENWIKVQTLGDPSRDLNSMKYPALKMSFRPVTCMHCQDPPCLKACPDEAISRGEDGIVLIDQEKCTGCELCLPACPYDVIHFDSEARLARKCTLCRPRIEQGLEPFCARECPVGTIHFGELSAPGGELDRLIAGRGGYVLLPEKETVPSNHYLPDL
ncbi:MAG: 4Fe-4S dicluster domain-containing protein [Dehalococcoidia bacterium]|nr:4Fe-4S dicluster domain-containing protein [Dehalococcoidia bacterium]